MNLPRWGRGTAPAVDEVANHHSPHRNVLLKPFNAGKGSPLPQNNDDMKTTKTIFAFLAILCLLSATLSSCALATSTQIEDTNGDAKELAVITDADIQDGTYGSTMLVSSTYSEGHNTSGVVGGNKDKDNSYNRLSVKKFSGILTVNVCKGNGADVTYTIESTVSSGNFKMVIMDEDHQILHVVPIDEKATVTIPTEKGKLYFVTIAGESAEIKVELRRSMA